MTDHHVHVHVHSDPPTQNLFTGRTLIGVCLDRSGSMEAIRQATIDGFNEWLGTQKRTMPNALLTMVKFDTEYEFPYTTTLLPQVEPLSFASFVPRGSTALNDAIVHTVHRMERDLQFSDRALLLVVTDGEENASKEYREVSRVRALLETKQGTGRWTLVWLRGSLDVQAGRTQAQTYGVPVSNTFVYQPTAQGSTANWQATNAATSTYAKSGTSQSQDFFAGQGTTDTEAEKNKTTPA